MIFNLRKYAAHSYVLLDEAGNVMDQTPVGRGRPRAGYVRVDEQGNIVEAPQRVAPQIRPTGPTPGPPVPAVPEQTGLSRGRQPVGVVDAPYAPNPQKIEQMTRFVNTNIVSGIKGKPVEPLPVEWQNDADKQYIANLTWDRVSVAGSQIDPEFVERMLSEMLQDSRFSAMPEKYRSVLQPEQEAAQEEGLEAPSGNEHAVMMEAAIKNSPESVIWQAFIQFENVGEGLIASIQEHLSDKRKYGFFRRFPEEIPADVKAGLAEVGWSEQQIQQWGEVSFSNRVAVLPKDDPIRAGLDEALTRTIAENFSERAPVDISDRDWSGTLELLSNIEKYVVMKASGKGGRGSGDQAGGLSREQAGSFGVDQETGGQLLPEGVVPGTAGPEDLAQQQKGLTQQLLSITQPTISSVADLTHEVADAWRKSAMDYADRTGNSNKLHSHLGYADVLELFAELAQVNFERLVELERGEGVAAELGSDVTRLKGEGGIEARYTAGETDNDGRVLYWNPPDLSKLTTQAAMNEILKKLVAEKKLVLQNATGYDPSADPVSRDAQVSQIIGRIQAGHPDIQFSPEFVEATLTQGQDSIKMLAREAKVLKNGPQDAMKHRIFTALDLLEDVVMKDRAKYDPEVVKAWFSLVGRRKELKQPLKLDAEHQIQWIDKVTKVGGKPKKITQRDPETGQNIPVRVPAFLNASGILRMPLYYSLTETPVSDSLKALLEESGMAESPLNEAKDEKSVDAQGNVFFKERVQPSLTIDANGIIRPKKLDRKQSALIDTICKYAFKELKMLHAMKKAMFKQSSAERVFDGCKAIESRKNQIITYLSSGIRRAISHSV